MTSLAQNIENSDNQANKLSVEHDFLRHARNMEAASVFRYSAKVLLEGLRYFPDNEEILKELYKKENFHELSDIPEATSIFLALGKAHSEDEDTRKAFEYFKIVLLINPDDPTAIFEIARIQDARKRRLARIRLGEIGGSAKNCLKFAKRMEAEEGPDRALEILHEAEGFYPKDENILFHLGELYFKRGEFGKVKTYSETILQNHPDSEKAASLLGKLKQKEIEEKEGFLVKSPGNLSILISLARMKYGASDLTTASNYYRNHLSKDPRFKATKMRLNECGF